MCGETSPRLILSKSKLSISMDQHSGILFSFFLLYVQVIDYQNLFKLRC